MSKTILALLALLCLAGCAATLGSSYRPGANEPTASVVLVGNTNSTDTQGRHYNLFLSRDNTCAQKTLVRLGGKLIAEDHIVLPASGIPAGGPVTLVVRYIEARPSMVRVCGNTARFTPEAGKTYEVRFDVTDQGQQCAIALQQASGEPVSLQPSDSCYAQAPADGQVVPNGRAYSTIYSFR